MPSVTELYAKKGPAPLWICDFSPPRSGDPNFAERAKVMDVDFFSVAYSPGQSVRMDTVAAAATLKRRTGKEVIFNVATRDMNRLAIQMHLLGAQALELDNVLIVRGDDFSAEDSARIKTVADYNPSELMEAIKQLNAGIDLRGKKLRMATRFCIGAIVDPHRDVEKEAALAQRKLASGASYFITQSVYGAEPLKALRTAYKRTTNTELTVPIFCGVQIMEPGGLSFGKVPEWVERDVAKGRSGVDIAVQIIDELLAAGCDAFYLVPPILKGGRRDYEALQRVVATVRARYLVKAATTTTKPGVRKPAPLWPEGPRA